MLESPQMARSQKLSKTLLAKSVRWMMSGPRAQTLTADQSRMTRRVLGSVGHLLSRWESDGHEN